MPDIPILKSRRSWPFHTALGQREQRSYLPRVSVIIPSYNQVDYLESAIRSVLCQDYPNLECLVLDAGSQDGSAEVIRHYQSALAYARSEPDSGQAAAVNEGALHATGDFVSFLNSDDMLTAGAVSKVVQTYTQHPEAKLVYGQRILIDHHDAIHGWSHDAPFDHKRMLYTINSETAFWRKEVYDELGGFNESLRFALDLEFFCRIYARYPTYMLNDFLGYYRFHPNSKSETISDVGRAEAAEHWQKIFGEPLRPSSASSASIAARMLHFMAAIRRPRLLLIPYLQQKLSRTT